MFKNILNSIWNTILATAAVVLGLVIIAIVRLESNLPDINALKQVELQVPLKIFTNDGKLIAEYGDKRRTPLKIDDIPDKLIFAIIATEDRRFFQHHGVDLRGLMRAAVNLVSSGRKAQGGSTITMQVARNFFLTRKKTYMRKINEILLALKIEEELTKEEILVLYLNKIYLGNRAYGVAAAAKVYYGTTPNQLTLAQMAMIAGLPKAPSAINPLYSAENALKRREHVLSRMLNYNLISKEEYEEASNAPVSAKYHGKKIEIQAPYVAEMARQFVVDKYQENAYDKGYQVYTTIDSKLQRYANFSVTKSLLEYDKRHGYRGAIKKLTLPVEIVDEEEQSLWINDKLKEVKKVHHLEPAYVHSIDEDNIIVETDKKKITITKSGYKWIKTKDISKVLPSGSFIYIERIGKKYYLSQVPEVEGAFIALEPNNGKILALLGGFNYNESPFNRAIQAYRQPGSSFKPFIYGAAIENGYTAASIINDAPIVQENMYAETDWRPQNHNKSFYGPTRLRTGITQSRNLVSIRLLESLGINNAIDFINKCGIPKDNLPNSLSLALGANSLTPLELASGYAVFPNGGKKINTSFIDRIESYNGDIIYQEEQTEPKQAISPQTSFLVTTMLQDVIQYGTSRRAKSLGRRDLAGKTGTTNDQFDAWFSGFNRDIVATSWVGYDEPKTLKEYAVRAALPMWMYFMELALKGKPENNPEQPEGLTTVKIDPDTGLLAHPSQVNSIYEIFTNDTLPTKIAPLKKTDLASIEDEEMLEVEEIF